MPADETKPPSRRKWEDSDYIRNKEAYRAATAERVRRINAEKAHEKEARIRWWNRDAEQIIVKHGVRLSAKDMGFLRTVKVTHDMLSRPDMARLKQIAQSVGF